MNLEMASGVHADELLPKVFNVAAVLAHADQGDVGLGLKSKGGKYNGIGLV